MGRPLSVYIHIPFCVRKCGYCDFLSFPAGREDRNRYLEALAREIADSPYKGKGYEVQTVFLGGGTPSVLSGEETAGIMAALRSSFLLAEDAECTVEANPGTVTKEKLLSYQGAGLNRLSIGLQSVREEELRKLGRIHTFRDFERTFREAREAGFHNINVDLMYALPGQTLESLEESIRTVLSFAPEHISAYGLIIEEGTRFHRLYSGEGIKELPGEETEAGMYERAGERLKSAGYERYEISNYARPGFLCRHNCVYWERGEYLGFGLGAASLLDGARFCNSRELTDYCKDPLSFEEYRILGEKEAMEEFMFLGLRMRRGISEERFLQAFKTPVSQIYGEPMNKLIRLGLAERSRGYFSLTEKGNLLSNYALAEFLF